jgi:hypothetical protein
MVQPELVPALVSRSSLLILLIRPLLTKSFLLLFGEEAVYERVHQALVHYASDDKMMREGSENGGKLCGAKRAVEESRGE